MTEEQMKASTVGLSFAMCRRSERTRRAVERAGCEREPQSGRELDERLHGWPFCGDGEDESERGKPKAGYIAANTRRETPKPNPEDGNPRREIPEQSGDASRRDTNQNPNRFHTHALANG